MPEPRPQSRGDWIGQWQRVARRIRVPLGFATAALYVFELLRRAPHPAAVAWSLVLVVPGLLLRGYAAGIVEKNRELAMSGPYAHTRNPLYLGSMTIAAGFALALGNWLVALLLALGFLVIYVPVIVSEERYLRAKFPEFDDYCRRVPRLIPRVAPVRGVSGVPSKVTDGSFSFALYVKHREYNATLGATALYLCLLFLQPALGALFHRAR